MLFKCTLYSQGLDGASNLLHTLNSTTSVVIVDKEGILTDTQRTVQEICVAETITKHDTVGFKQLYSQYSHLHERQNVAPGDDLSANDSSHGLPGSTEEPIQQPRSQRLMQQRESPRRRSKTLGTLLTTMALESQTPQSRLSTNWKVHLAQTLDDKQDVPQGGNKQIRCCEVATTRCCLAENTEEPLKGDLLSDDRQENDDDDDDDSHQPHHDQHYAGRVVFDILPCPTACNGQRFEDIAAVKRHMSALRPLVMLMAASKLPLAPQQYQ